MRYLIITLMALVMAGCSSSQEQTPKPENVGKRVDQLIDQNKYDEALSMLNDMDKSPEVKLQLEKAHLNYGIYLEYEGGDRSMRDRMTDALRQYIEVLRLNPKNQKAHAEVQQIMGIYKTMPDKNVPDDIVNALDEMGVKY